MVEPEVRVRTQMAQRMKEISTPTHLRRRWFVAQNDCLQIALIRAGGAVHNRIESQRLEPVR